MNKKTNTELLFEQLFKHYDGVTVFLGGIAKARLNEKYGFIDTYFNELTPIKYDWITNFSPKGFAIAVLNKKECIINSEFKEITKIEFDEITPFYADGFARGLINDKLYKIDKEGKKQLIKEGAIRDDLYTN